MSNIEASEPGNAQEGSAFDQARKLSAELQAMAEQKEFLPNNINALVIEIQKRDGIDVGEAWFRQNVPDATEAEMLTAFLQAYERDFPISPQDNRRYPATEFGRITRGRSVDSSPEVAEQAEQATKASRFYFGKRWLGPMLQPGGEASLGDLGRTSEIVHTIGVEFELDEALRSELGRRLQGAGQPNAAMVAQTVSDFLHEYVDVRHYEDKLRRRFNETQGFTGLNETFSYHADGHDVFLHLAPSRTLTKSERGQQLLGSLSSLAVHLTQDADLANIERVRMISFLVSSYREVIVQLGFEVREVTDEQVLAAFGMTKGSLLEAHMAKDAFVQMYRPHS